MPLIHSVRCSILVAQQSFMHSYFYLDAVKQYTVRAATQGDMSWKTLCHTGCVVVNKDKVDATYQTLSSSLTCNKRHFNIYAIKLRGGGCSKPAQMCNMWKYLNATWLKHDTSYLSSDLETTLQPRLLPVFGVTGLTLVRSSYVWSWSSSMRKAWTSPSSESFRDGWGERTFWTNPFTYMNEAKCEIVFKIWTDPF